MWWPGSMAEPSHRMRGHCFWGSWIVASAASRGAHEAWMSEMDGKGLDGKRMFADLLALVKKYSK